MKNFTEKLKVFLFAGILFIGASYASAQWSGPTASPPNNNTPAPIHVGSGYQEREGVLAFRGAVGFFGGLVMQDGNEADGKVLVSDNNGFARWDNVSGVGGTVGFAQYVDYGTGNRLNQQTFLPITFDESGLLYFKSRGSGAGNNSNCVAYPVVESSTGVETTYDYGPIPIASGDTISRFKGPDDPQACFLEMFRFYPLR